MAESSGKPDYLHQVLGDARANEGKPAQPQPTTQQRLENQKAGATRFGQSLIEGAQRQLQAEQDLAAARAKLASEQPTPESTTADKLRKDLVTPSKPNAGLGMGIEGVGSR